MVTAFSQALRGTLAPEGAFSWCGPRSRPINLALREGMWSKPLQEGPDVLLRFHDGFCYMTYGRALESQARRCQERQSLMVRPPGGQRRCRWSNRGTSCHRNQGLEGGFQAREPDTHTAWPLHFYRQGSDFPEAKSKVSSATVRAVLTWPRTLFPSGFIPADSCLAHHVLTLNALYHPGCRASTALECLQRDWRILNICTHLASHRNQGHMMKS